MFNGLDYSMSLNMSMAFLHLFWGFPAARSRVVIRLAQGREAKPNANTRTLRPDKCLVVKSLDSSLRPVCPSQHGIHRHHHQGVEDRDGRCQRWRERDTIRAVNNNWSGLLSNRTVNQST